MILKGLGLTLAKHSQPITLYVKGISQKDANGEYPETPSTKFEVTWPSTPVSGKQLFLSEAGSYSSEDRNLFQLEPCDVDLKFNDEFKLKDIYYVIKDIKDMRNEAGFIRYLSKRKDPQVEPALVDLEDEEESE
jgi:hypothetical protein